MDKKYKWPWIVILVITILTVFFAIQLPKMRINNAVKIYLPDDHPSKIADNEMEEIFGSSDLIAIAIKNHNKNLLTEDNIELIMDLTKELEAIKNVEEVTSLVNSDYIEGTAEGMKVNDLVEELPKNNDDILEIKERLISWDIYIGNLYSNDLKSTQITVKLEKDLSIKEKEDVYFVIKDKLAQYKKGDIEFYVAGSPVVNVLLGDSMESDLKRLIPFVVIVVILALYLSFKNLGGVVLPMLVVSISTIWAIGIMALLNINLTIVSTVIPVLLVAVGSAYGIHLISHYYDELKETEGELDYDEHHDLVIEVVKKVGRPVLLAGLTTIAGFGSLATSSIIPIRQFGIFTAVGVATAVLVAITLIPAILLVRHENFQSKNKDKKDKESTINNIILALYHYFSQNRVRILILALAIIIVSTYGMSKIVIDNVMIEMFKKDTEIRQSDDFINNNFNGTNILTVMVAGHDKGSMTDPEVLKGMDEMGNYLVDKYPEVKKVTSFADFIKRMNKVMNYPQEVEESSNEEVASSFGQESTSSFGQETTSSFGEENTSSFGEETTSSFGEESTSNFGEETTSSFGEETTSSFGTSDEGNSSSNVEEVVEAKAPSNEKISEKEMIILLNKAIIKADKLNLTGEELVKVISKELNYQGEAYNEIPYDLDKYPVSTNEGLKNLISQYLLMYSGSLDDLINDQLEPSKARMIVQVDTGSNMVIKRIKEDIKSYVNKRFPKEYKIKISGHSDMALSVNELIVSSQIKSIITSLIIVFLIVTINYKSLIAGIYGIIPLGISLLINFGIMGYTGIKLDIGTSMVASIAIGIGVDYTVHFLATYNHERKKTDDLEIVCQNTLLTSGKAIIFNAISVAAGFAVLLFSKFNPLVNLGLLVTITMITSSTAAMTLLPALLNLFKPKFIRK